MTTGEGYVEVPGAKLFYKVRGDGPVLLVLPGGPGDADVVDGLAAAVGDHYTVVSYDRRGLSRSTIDNARHPTGIGTHSDDACRILAAVTDGPAYVFGSSLGALIALDLVTTRPEKVRLLVAHEAALADLLDEPERSQVKSRQHQIEATFEKAGLAPAMQELIALTGRFGDDPEPEVRPERPSGEQMSRHAANMQFFLRHDAPYAHRYKLNRDALRHGAKRIVPAAGQLSRDTMPYRCARALARSLDRDLEEFPGNHSGYASRPHAFGAELHRVFSRS
jgi:pimeloyl-ACP methyl ester carboxylesterase